MIWQQAEIETLQEAAHHDRRAYVRIKALALLKLAEGHSQSAVAAFFAVSARSIRRWLRGFRAEGVASLSVKPGRGRRPQADAEEIAFYVRQSPRNFGRPQTRWTLQALADTVPSLQGLSPAAVHYALARAGYAYKRGQPTRHSPDPDYAEKGGVSRRRSAKREPARAP